MTSSDSDMEDFAMDAQQSITMSVEEANKLNRQKLMAIMRSNSKLKAEMKQLKKEGSDNYRVKQIKNLRQQLRETQSIADALTKTLMSKTGMKQDEVGELYDEILSQPKLAKPNNPVKLKKDVLVLQQQQQATERELTATKKLLREYRSGERRPGDEDGLMSPKRLAPSPTSDSALADQLRQLRLKHEITVGEVETKTRVIDLHKEMCAKLQSENRELRQLRMQWELMEAAKEAAENEARRAREEVGRSAGHTEEYHQDLRELRTKLASVLSVRDKVEANHTAKVDTLHLQVAKVQERESHLLTQMGMLKLDLQHSLESVAWYKQQNAAAKHAASEKATQSEKVWELQTKNAVLARELKETRLELKSQPGRGRVGEAERALQERVAQLQHDNARLSAQMDIIERKYLVHHESASSIAQQLEQVQTKYNAALRELDEKHEKFADNNATLQEMRARNEQLEQRLQAGAEQWQRAQQEQSVQAQEWNKQEQLITQLKNALQERTKQLADAGGIGAGQGNHNLTARSNSSDDLFPSRPSAEATATAKAVKKVEETHLEHVAKLMKNFELKEKDMLYQIARLNELVKPGSGNRTHLGYKNAYAPPRPAAAAAVNKQAFKDPFASSSDEEEEEDESDDDL